MAKVLVTGGLGFLGSHLVEALCGKGENVTVVDNLSANVISPEFCRGRCEFYSADILDFQAPVRFDAIYHLANTVGSTRILPFGGILGYQVIAGIETILNLATQHRASVVYLSSSDVYGRAQWLSEESPTQQSSVVTPRREYAVSKLLAEIMLLNGARANGLRVNIIRPFNIAGPRQLPGPGFVIPRFITAALAGAPLTVFGDGSQVRSFVHVTEVAEACQLVGGSHLRGEVINVGNPSNVVSIYELANRIVSLCQSDSPIEFVDPHVVYGEMYDDGVSKLPVIDKVTSQLGWAPQLNLNSILEDSLRWLAANREEWNGKRNQHSAVSERTGHEQ